MAEAAGYDFIGPEGADIEADPQWPEAAGVASDFDLDENAGAEVASSELVKWRRERGVDGGARDFDVLYTILVL